MKRFLIWFFALLLTLAAAYYQRKTGPTYPKKTEVTINDSLYILSLIRSISLDERSEVKLIIADTSIKARIFFRRFPTDDEYQAVPFVFNTRPVESYVMNKIFNITEEKGFFAQLPPQPPAGKLQYYIEITDNKGTQTILQDSPLIIRFKGGVPGYILTPHILLMFFAMFFSTLAGLMGLFNDKDYRKYSVVTLVLLAGGGMILGPLVQKYAFGEFWTGVPFGWDLTDNKTLIAFVFWAVAVIMNRRQKSPVYTIVASVVLLIIFSIPHSLFGSELDYSSGRVIQGVFLYFIIPYLKKS